MTPIPDPDWPKAIFDALVSLDGVIDTARWLQEQLGRPVPGMLVKAGGFPPSREHC
jgi:hypothetical protein